MVKRKARLWPHPEGRWYVRIPKGGGKYDYFRIHAAEGTPEFDREY
jgi:hypothetical protein